MSNLIFSTAADEIHSFDSYLGAITTEHDITIIPVINIGVSNHPINQTTEMKYVDRSYLVFEGLISMNEEYDLQDSENGIEIFYFGGFDLQAGVHREWQVKCKAVHLVLLATSKISYNMWNPESMDQDELKDFLKVQNQMALVILEQSNSLLISQVSMMWRKSSGTSIILIIWEALVM